jgi:hypothetical protein
MEIMIKLKKSIIRISFLFSVNLNEWTWNIFNNNI